MDFSNESWFHDIPTLKQGYKMHQCKEHFKKKMNQQCSNNIGDILGLVQSFSAFFWFFFGIGFVHKSDSTSPNHKLKLLMLMLTALFQGILLIVTIVMFCTSYAYAIIMVSAVFSTFLVLILPPSVRFCKKYSSPERGSSGVAQNTQQSDNGNVPAEVQPSQSAECENTPRAPSKDPPSYNQATLPSYLEATELRDMDRQGKRSSMWI